MRVTCGVCNSPYTIDYEIEYYNVKGKIAWTELSDLAKAKGETLGRKAFKKHFENGHYKPGRVHSMLKQGRNDSKIEETKAQVINILDEIKTNLNGLKDLIPKAETSSEAVAIYKECRLTLQDIERLRGKLTSNTSLSLAELYREIYWSTTNICEDCRDKFWVQLDDRLKKKGFN